MNDSHVKSSTPTIPVTQQLVKLTKPQIIFRESICTKISKNQKSEGIIKYNWSQESFNLKKYM